MKLPICYYGNPILRKKGERINEINDELRQFVQDMIETMIANNGIGIAAQQVGQALNIFITHPPIDIEGSEWPADRPVRVFINPKITAYSEEEIIINEPCLSLPGISGDVRRPVRVTFEVTDLEGKTFIEEFDGFEARMMMHENDHINGVLYIDRMDKRDRKELEPALREIKKKYSKGHN